MGKDEVNAKKIHRGPVSIRTVAIGHIGFNLCLLHETEDSKNKMLRKMDTSLA
jgi:hypothetical protein